MANNMAVLYDYIFHYNHFTEEWNAFKREDSQKYFNGELVNPLRSPSIKDLITYLTSTLKAE